MTTTLRRAATPLQAPVTATTLPGKPGAGAARAAAAAAPAAPKGDGPKPQGVGDATEAVRMLEDPRLSLLPSFLTGVKYKEHDDLPIEGTVKEGRLDKPVWLPHVRQGKLGDCWYMGTQAAIALAEGERFKLGVRRLDEDHVAVRFGGGEVGLKDTLPTRRDGKLAYARANTPHFSATWPVWYEKAAAAERGSYKSLEGGWPREAFELILGSAPKRIDQPGDLFQYMHEARGAGQPVAVTTRSSQSALMEQVGIYANHTYAVRKMIVRPGNGKDADIVGVKLWNPWGGEHPKVLSYEQFQSVADSITTADEFFHWGGTRGDRPR